MPEVAKTETEASKKRGRQAKTEGPEMCLVLVMHKTNIMLKDYSEKPPRERKVPFREKAYIPVDEFKRICAGDEIAGRPLRLERIG